VAAIGLLALGGASLSGAQAAIQPHVFAPSVIIPPAENFVPARSDIQQIVAAAPERAKLAAEAKARAEAVARERAAAAAAAAAAGRGSYSASSASASWSSGSTINVWTTGFQAQVNACRGGVDLTGAYHTRTVGEHWSCGGASFPESPGAIVHFTGLDAGTYRVIGLVATLDAYTAHTSNIPHGYAMLFQTCRGGDSHYTIFIALARA
jgi:hypothetical protein